MANSPILIELPSGLDNLTAKLFAISTQLGDANPVNDEAFDNLTGPDALNEYTNREGLYYTYVDEALAGWHYLLVEDADDNSTVATGWVYLTDTTNYHYVQFDVPSSDASPTSVANAEYYNIVTRSTADNNALFFEWPDTGRTITSKVSFNGGPYGSVSGNISEVRAEGSGFLYQLSFSSADRANVGVSEYELTDGITTRYLPLATDSGGSNGGAGLYQLNISVRNITGDVLQGARVNVDSTTLTQTSNSLGQIVFNLDSGAYVITCSPPAGYDTPSSQVANIVTADQSMVFVLTPTDPDAGGDGCTVPWI